MLYTNAITKRFCLQKMIRSYMTYSHLRAFLYFTAYHAADDIHITA